MLNHFSIPTFRQPSSHTVVMYLCTMGVLAAAALAVGLLLFVAYLLQCLLLSIGEIVTIFNSLDSVVRLLLVAIVFVLLAWRASEMMKGHSNGC